MTYNEVIEKLCEDYNGDVSELTDEEYKTILDWELGIYEPRLRKAMENGLSKEDACGWICDLYHEYEIQEITEFALYEIADPNDEVDEAPYDILMELEGDNPLLRED